MSHQAVDEQAICIDWAAQDPENPYFWSSARKARILLVCFLFTATTVVNGTAYPLAQERIRGELHTSETTFLLGNFTYFSLGIACVPLLVSPLSEIYGRLRLYLVGSLLMA